MSGQAMTGQRQIAIDTPLGDDELLLVEVEMREELGRMFCAELLLYSRNEAIDIDAILGQNLTITLLCAGAQSRYINGFVTAFVQLGWAEERGDREFVQYRATVHPWLWFLTRSADCRIFQRQTVVEIVKQVFHDQGFSDVEDALSGRYRQRDYCVQYRETAFSFVSRLLEEEGIYYFFRHQQGRHLLVLADGQSSHAAIAGSAELPFHAPGTDQSFDEERVSRWRLRRSIEPGRVVLTDYDFKKPRTSLLVSRSISRGHAEAQREWFDYPGEYSESADGEQYALERIEERQADFERVTAETNARFMATGGLFRLSEHPRADQNREYLVVSARYSLRSDAFSSGAAAALAPFDCEFCAIESKTTFRAPRSTPKARVRGPQTAVVVGPAGEEIYPDEFGRIKVQFHWDRYGARDENSTGWLRVAQSWAGAGWGAQFIPRVGQEVVVDFLEGDPDQPIVTGQLYNADQMPPYALPANKTQSGIRSRSSAGGNTDNFNEIRLEDKKGAEAFYVQAEKDYTQWVKHDRSETIGHDRSLEVGHDKRESIAHDKSISVGANHSEAIVANKSVNVGGSHTELIGGNMTITVAQNVTETIAINYAETVGAAMELSIGGLMAETVGGHKEQNIGLSKRVSVAGDFDERVGDSKQVGVGKEWVLDAGEQITLRAGQASITLRQDGTIVIRGVDISIDGSGTVQLGAAKALELASKGSLAIESSGDATIKSGRTITIKGRKILQN